jgi:hypothetical protein
MTWFCSVLEISCSRRRRTSNRLAARYVLNSARSRKSPTASGRETVSSKWMPSFVRNAARKRIMSRVALTNAPVSETIPQSPQSRFSSFESCWVTRARALSLVVNIVLWNTGRVYAEGTSCAYVLTYMHGSRMFRELFRVFEDNDMAEVVTKTEQEQDGRKIQSLPE